jgi:F-type H+-transporting ATPase subunit b
VQIDWITVIAQIANFLVLVWLLQRFLYQPITGAMARREEEIENRLKEAKTARKEVDGEAKELKRKQEDLEAEKQQILEDTRQEARSLKDRLNTELQKEMETRRKTWGNHLEEEREDFANALRRRAGHEVIAITEQMLQEFAGTDLASEIAQGFAARLDDLESDARKKLAAAAEHTSDPAIVESSFTLDAGARRQITRAAHKALGSDTEIKYRQNEDLVLGVRLTIGEQTLEWSAGRHLKRLEIALDEVIDSKAFTRSSATGAQGG